MRSDALNVSQQGLDDDLVEGFGFLFRGFQVRGFGEVLEVFLLKVVKLLKIELDAATGKLEGELGHCQTFVLKAEDERQLPHRPWLG